MNGLTDKQRRELADAIADFGDQVATHTGEAIGALEFVDERFVDDDMVLSPERYRAEDIAVKQAVAHSLLAIGLRLEVLTSLTTAFAMPELAPDSRLEE